MEMNYPDVLCRLKEERELLGLTQVELCRKLYMSQGHYSKAESGKNRFTCVELKNLQRAGIDLHYVYTGERIVREEYYEFFEGCEQRIMRCLAEIALPLISHFAWKLSSGNAASLQNRIRNVQCILFKNRQEDSCFYQIRRFKAYSQQYMASLLGVDIKKYTSLEKRKNFGDSEVVLHMYNCFQISPLLLLNDESGLAREVSSLLECLGEKESARIFSHLKMVAEDLLG